MRTAAILPVKRFAEAKRRLGEAVARDLRRELARAMVGDVLAALAQTAGVHATIVVTSEPAARALALEHGATVIEDSAQDGQSTAVALGIGRAMADGFARVLCVPGDCPALDPGELDALLGGEGAGAGEGRSGDGEGGAPSGAGKAGSGARAGAPHALAAPRVVVIPDRHGTGTNGLLLAPPDAIEPGFGPDSCERHLQRARAAAVACEVARVPSLLLDVDTGSDLAALRERLAGERAHAPQTRAVLAGVPVGTAA